MEDGKHEDFDMKLCRSKSRERKGKGGGDGILISFLAHYTTTKGLVPQL